MPPASEEFTLYYEGMHGLASHCRVRVYRPEGSPPVIVASQACDVEDPGTSVTNRAELIHRLAWSRIGEQWPVIFIEHYADEQDKDGQDQKGLGECWRIISFQLKPDGLPQLREDMSGGRVSIIEEYPDGSDVDENEQITFDIAFAKPSWKDIERQDVERAIGTRSLVEPIKTEIARATIENSPVMWFTIEQFPFDQYPDENM